METDMLPEGVSIYAVVQAMQGGCCQPVLSLLPLCLRRLQPVTQRHQFVHFGDDTVLFGEGREGKRKQSEVRIVDSWIGLPTHLFLDALDHEWAAQGDPQIFGEDQAKTVKDSKGSACDWRGNDVVLNDRNVQKVRPDAGVKNVASPNQLPRSARSIAC